MRFPLQKEGFQLEQKKSHFRMFTLTGKQRAIEMSKMLFDYIYQDKGKMLVQILGAMCTETEMVKRNKKSTIWCSISGGSKNM